ncbi:hypothetical protein D1115_06485 [Vibrio alfacsensis]|uniref:CRISPR type III-associated protein domain-containing protein n=1 Tax=Vibrio alfacsensis TaxID=1074311 RepID=A0ABM6YTR1_9VIBR|nr:RAMP superfamily CRISPR-associated protein [Vibrio alfacsensis]AXY00926.1 hypothetical protein D1115_06485 [Vibrio alfacsensis]
MGNTQITLTKLVIETQSPMAISTGQRETGFDTQLARDVNGLPTIPATAIAGVWSHLVETHLGEQTKKAWFGFTDSKNAKVSALTISDAKLLNSRGKTMANFTPAAEMENDPLLALCLNTNPLHRERVAINDRGVTCETGKFDQILIPKGVRFALTLQWTNQRDASLTQTGWHELLALWADPTFAFGSSTRNGLGRIKVVHSDEHVFELQNNAQGAQQFADYRKSSVEPTHKLAQVFTELETNVETYSIKLRALDNWRSGSGSELLTDASKLPEKSVNIITYSEKSVVWGLQNQASISNAKPMLCGSSIKGILAHRIAFHYRKHQKRWAETMDNASHDEWQQRPEELKALLGIAAENHEDSLAGALWVEDAELHYTDTVIRHHNSIDRFTGGVRKGALYSEELLHKPRFEVRLHLSKEIEDEVLKKAFEDTLQDLELGLLPMGAGSGRGTSLVVKDEEAA